MRASSHRSSSSDLGHLQFRASELNESRKKAREEAALAKAAGFEWANVSQTRQHDCFSITCTEFVAFCEYDGIVVFLTMKAEEEEGGGGVCDEKETVEPHHKWKF